MKTREAGDEKGHSLIFWRGFCVPAALRTVGCGTGQPEVITSKSSQVSSPGSQLGGYEVGTSGTLKKAGGEEKDDEEEIRRRRRR